MKLLFPQLGFGHGDLFNIHDIVDIALWSLQILAPGFPHHFVSVCP